MASSSPSLSEQVAQQIEAQIMGDRLPSGSRIGLRTELIARFGVGAAVMNEALRLLRERGLVVVRPGPRGGVFVDELPPQVRLGALDLWFRPLSVDPLQLFESRTHLEDMFTSLAVDRAAPEDVRAMEWAVHDMRQHADDPQGFLAANMRFHLAVARASRLGLLVSFYEGIAAMIANGLTRAAYVGPNAREIVEHNVGVHQRILDAISSGDQTRLPTLLAEHRLDLIRVSDTDRQDAEASDAKRA